MRYGMPYKGSKNAISEKIISVLPPAKHFYDLFGGGGAISHCALLSGKYKQVHYNELDHLVFNGFKMAVNGEFKNENRWISREDFVKLKDTNPYVAICFSFGNDLKTYCYSLKREPFKKAVHNFLFFNDKKEIKQFIPVDNCKFSSDEISVKRLEFQRYLKNYIDNIKDYCNCYSKNPSNVLQSLERLQSLESLESLESLQSLERLQRLELSNKSYEELSIKDNSIIYCDPPYKNTNSYKIGFNHSKFYEWARKQNNIFISEYTMPDDFIEIASFDKRVLMDATLKSKNKQEKIFTNPKTYENFSNIFRLN